MTDQTPAPAPDRPLVTFALFAYNQEAYIREAIEGAFAQTYEPLEIILSDDCSSDRTFEIMQEMAAAYEGPHEVRVRRSIPNLGTALHVQMAFETSSGALFVVAAGDDISNPDRVERLVMAWEAAGRAETLLHSGRETFGDGPTKTVPAKRTPFSGRDLEGFAAGHWLPAAAPTCAYSRAVFTRFAPLLGGSIIEDMPLALRAALLAPPIAVEAPLVRQRLHYDSVGTGYTANEPARWNRFILSKIIAFRTIQRDLASWDGPINAALRARIERRILAALGSASSLIIPETRPLGALDKARLAVRLVSSPAVTQSLISRLNFALGFLGFTFQNSFKTLVRKFRSKG